MKHLCSVCRIEKESDEFNYKNNYSQVQSYCKVCQKNDRIKRKLLKDNQNMRDLIIKLYKEFNS